MGQQVFVVHVEPKGTGRGVEVGAIDENGNSFDTVGLQDRASQNMVQANAATGK
jgi:hypothetical protein